MEDIVEILFYMIILIATFVYSTIRKDICLHDAENGKDKDEMKKVVKSYLPDKDCQIIYAHGLGPYYPGLSRTNYHYIFAFYEQIMLVYPVTYVRKEKKVYPLNCFILNSRSLSEIKVKTRNKNGELKRLDVRFRIKDGSILRMFFDTVNLRITRIDSLFNIFQKEECEKFEEFLEQLSEVVKKENPCLNLVIETSFVRRFRKFGMRISVFGFFIGILFPAIGMGMCTIGLILDMVYYFKGMILKRRLVMSSLCTGLMILYGLLRIFIK